MSKPVIACDVDEVLFPFIDNFLIEYNKRNNTNFISANFNEYHFHETLGLSVEDTVNLVYDYLGADHSQIELIEGVEDAIERLSKKYDLEIVTARHPKFELSTWQWIQDRLPGKFRAIKLIGYAPITNNRVSKAEICLEIGAEVLIDDSLEHLEECSVRGIKGILFGDYPWNKADQLPEDVIRCYDWQAIAKYFGV